MQYYDPDRNLTQSVKPGNLTMIGTYDALDRPLATTYPNDATLNVSRHYDEPGHGFGIGYLTSATDQAGSLSLTYDQRADITNESRTVTGAGTLNTATAYDKAMRVQSITYPSGTLVHYTRNAMGQVTAVTATPPAGSASNVATGISYKPFPSFGIGPVKGLTYGNGVAGAYGFDPDYRNTTRKDTGAAPVQSLSYSYYLNNSVYKIADTVNAANSQTLHYDTLDRLTGAASGTGGYGTFSFTWDPVSNLTAQTINGTKTSYSHKPGTNRLSGITTAGTTTTVTSTPTGNLATFKTGTTTTETLLYNQANQLASAQTTSTFASYAYDLTGQRLEKSQPGVNPILYQFNRTGGELLSENDLHNGTTADYIYLDPGRNSQPLGEVNPTTSKLYFTHTDKLGTPQVLTDSTQSVAWSATYQPFGSTVQFNGPLATQSLRLPGQQFDAETGYNHNGFRNYAGTLTRYLESDPVGLKGGMNTYQYVGGNTFKWTDPNGTNWAFSCPVGAHSVTNWGCVAGMNAMASPATTILSIIAYQSVNVFTITGNPWALVPAACSTGLIVGSQAVYNTMCSTCEADTPTPPTTTSLDNPMGTPLLQK